MKVILQHITILSLLLVINLVHGQTWNPTYQSRKNSLGGVQNSVSISGNYATISTLTFTDTGRVQEIIDSGTLEILHKDSSGFWETYQIINQPDSILGRFFGERAFVIEDLLFITAHDWLYIYRKSDVSSQFVPFQEIDLSDFEGRIIPSSGITYKNGLLILSFNYGTGTGNIIRRKIIGFRLDGEAFNHKFSLDINDSDISNYEESIFFNAEFLIVGLRGQSPNSGSVLVYKWNHNGDPVLNQTIVPSATNWKARIFGARVLLQGDLLLISDPFASYKPFLVNPVAYDGTVHVYSLSNSDSFRYSYSLENPQLKNYNGFGFGLASSNNEILISSTIPKTSAFVPLHKPPAIFRYLISSDSLLLIDTIKYPRQDTVRSFGYAIASDNEKFITIGNVYEAYHVQGSSGFQSARRFFIYEFCTEFHSVRDSFCSSYTFDDSTINIGGKHYFVFQNTSGCDSLVELNLIRYEGVTSIDYDRTKLFSLDSFDSYIWIDCESGDTLNRRSFFEPNQSGSYKLLAMSNGCLFKSKCINIEITKNYFCSDFAFITVRGSRVIKSKEFETESLDITIYDYLGRKLHHEVGEFSKLNVTLPNTYGIYIIEIRSEHCGIVKKVLYVP